jgi:hypothetical protein
MKNLWEMNGKIEELEGKSQRTLEVQEGSEVSDQECCKSHGLAVPSWHQTKETMKYFLHSFLPSMSYLDHNLLRVSGKKKPITM